MCVKIKSFTLMAGSVQQSTQSLTTVDDGTTELGSRDMGPANSSLWDD